MSGVISGVGFWSFWLRLPSPGPKLSDESILLEFVLETTLEFESFKPMTDF